MRTRRNLISLLTALCLALTLLSPSALAAEPAGDMADFTEDGAAALALLTGGDNTRASWDADSKTLTLSGVDFTTSAPVAVLVPDGSTVVLADGTENRITCTAVVTDRNSYALACGKKYQAWMETTGEAYYAVDATGTLCIQGQQAGTGKLRLQGGEVHEQAGAGFKSAGLTATDLTIKSGEITAVSGEEYWNVGIYSPYKDVRFNFSGGVVNAEGKYGIWINGTGNMSVSNDAEINAVGSSGPGIVVPALEVSGGTVKADGYIGIVAFGSGTNISGGTVTASGRLYALDPGDKSVFSGGTIALSGGIFGDGGNGGSVISVTGSDVTCTGPVVCDTLSVTSGSLSAATTDGSPVCRLGIGLAAWEGNTPTAEGLLTLGENMLARCSTDGAAYKTPIHLSEAKEEYLYDLFPSIYTPFYYIYYMLLEGESGTTPATNIKIAPASAFEPIEKTFTITAEAGDHGSISPAGAVTVAENGSQTFTIQPDSGYRVADVLVDGGSAGAVSTYTFARVQGDHTIRALFERVPGSSGGGSGSGSGGTVSQKPTVTAGQGGTAAAKSDGTVTIVPQEGYEIASVTVNGKTVSVPAGGKLTGLKATDKVHVTFAPVQETPVFLDVPAGFWAEEAIDWAHDSGYMNGKTAETFDPAGTVTRQQLWMILARLSGQAPADFAQARDWAVSAGVSDGTAPGSPVTRQQMVAILHRYAALTGRDVSAAAELTAFPDSAALADYARTPMAWAVSEEIVGGTAQGLLDPAGTATRAQFAAILYRFCGETL